MMNSGMSLVETDSSVPLLAAMLMIFGIGTGKNRAEVTIDYRSLNNYEHDFKPDGSCLNIQIIGATVERRV